MLCLLSRTPTIKNPCGNVAFQLSCFPHALSTPSRTPTSSEKLAFTLQLQKMAPTSKTYTERSHALTSHDTRLLCAIQSPCVYSFSTLTHRILCYHCICNASTAKWQFFFQIRTGRWDNNLYIEEHYFYHPG